MKLTKEKAKELANKYLLDSKIKDGEFLYAHTKGVVEAAKLLAKREKLDIKKIESCAWVHDIGSYLEQESHAKKGIELLEKEGIDIDEVLRDCVLNHGNSGNPTTKEGKIMQIADKISIMNNDFLEILLNKKIGKEEIGFIKMMFDKSIKMLEKLK